MCQIIAGPSAKIRSTLLDTPGLIANLFTTNPDGLGVMYKNRSGLVVHRQLPLNVDEVRRMVLKWPQDERNLVCHWRWRTHGATDLANCHPFDVVPGKVAMVHNGMLETGNAKDPTRSDTWHFIQDFMADSVAAAPAIIHRQSYLDLIGEFIGDNRFVLMDDAGEMSIVNRAQGLEHDGMWFANEYAWKPQLLIAGYVASFNYGGWSGYFAEEDDACEVSLYNHRPRQGHSVRHTADAPVGYGSQLEESFIENVLYSDSDAASRQLTSYPYGLLKKLFKEYEAQSAYQGGERDALPAACGRAVELAERGDVAGLLALANDDASSVADTLCYYLTWTLRYGYDEVPDRLAAVDDDYYAAAEVDGPPWLRDEHRQSTVQPERLEISQTYMSCRIGVYDCGVRGYSFCVVDDSGEEMAAEDGYSTAGTALKAARAAIHERVAA